MGGAVGTAIGSGTARVRRRDEHVDDGQCAVGRDAGAADQCATSNASELILTRPRHQPCPKRSFTDRRSTARAIASPQWAEGSSNRERKLFYKRIGIV